MLGLCGRRLRILLSDCRNAGDSVTHLRFVHKDSVFSRSHSSKSLFVGKKDKRQEPDGCFTVSYLMHSCGLSPELALSASKRVTLDTRDRPDSVLKVLRDHELTGDHISVVVKKCPRLLSVNVGTILPKLEFFVSIGISGAALSRLLRYNPGILLRSLKRTLVPYYDMIKSLHLRHHFKIDRFFMKLWMDNGANVLGNVAPNVSVLRALPVPEALVCSYLAFFTQVMSIDNNQFKENVNEVISMGFCPRSSKTFMPAVVVITEARASERARKMQVCRSWGWSEDDWLVAFKKNPYIVSSSEKKISSIMYFLVNKMGWEPADVAGCPTVFSCSLVKCIIPRCSVIRILLLKGLIRKGEFSLSTVLKTSREYFLSTIVIKYQGQVPELLNLFEGKIALEELGLGFEERGGTKQL